MATSDVYGRAVDRWQASGVNVLAPASESELVRTFEQLDTPLSNDVRALYRATGGFPDLALDGFFSLWSLARLYAENRLGQEVIWFADYLIMSHLYGVQYRDAETSAIVLGPGEPFLPIAASMTEFLEKYLANPNDVYAFDARYSRQSPGP